MTKRKNDALKEIRKSGVISTSYQILLKLFNRQNQLLFLLLFLIFADIMTCDASDSPSKKLCWAHNVAWGCDQVGRYDQWFKHADLFNPLSDRSLLGRNIQWDSGVTGGTRRQIEIAHQWGIDGFCVDVVQMDHVNGIMGRFFRAAEGTDFKIALCIDNGRLGVTEMIDALTEFLRKYRTHPNTALMRGKAIIFAYNLGLDMDDWLKVRKTLTDRGLDAFYLVRPVSSELSLWDNDKTMAGTLAGSNGLYDFGCNGFTLRQMTARLKNGRDSLKKYRPDGILVAGIAPGYLGAVNSFYRPFLNTQSLRNNWEAALENDADQVCLTTWNDYNEHTHFEPSAVNRTALLRINREYLRKWRGEPHPQRPPEVIVSYHEEFLAGDDWTIELLSFPYDTARQTALLRLCDESGKPIRVFDPVPLLPDRISATTFRMTGRELLHVKNLRVQLAIVDNTADKTNKNEPFRRELYPVTRRISRLESLRTVHIPIAETIDIPIHLELKNTEIPGKRTAVITMTTWSAAGKMELLRNGWPVAEIEVDHIKSPICKMSIPLPADSQIPEEVWVARFSDCSDSLAFSNPVTSVLPGLDRQTNIPILETGADFDEYWPAWYERISRFAKPRILPVPVRESEIFSVHYKFEKKNQLTIISATPWKIPVKIESGKTPVQWDQKTKTLRMDGDDTIRFPFRFFPYGPFTFSVRIQPESTNRKDREMPLFIDSALKLSLDRENRPVAVCRDKKIVSSQAIPLDRPSRITVTCDLENVSLFIDGHQTANGRVGLKKIPINSTPIFGKENASGFHGLLFDLELKAEVH